MFPRVTHRSLSRSPLGSPACCALGGWHRRRLLYLTFDEGPQQEGRCSRRSLFRPAQSNRSASPTSHPTGSPSLHPPWAFSAGATLIPCVPVSLAVRSVSACAWLPDRSCLQLRRRPPPRRSAQPRRSACSGRRPLAAKPAMSAETSGAAVAISAAPYGPRLPTPAPSSGLRSQACSSLCLPPSLLSIYGACERAPVPALSMRTFWSTSPSQPCSRTSRSARSAGLARGSGAAVQAAKPLPTSSTCAPDRCRSTPSSRLPASDQRPYRGLPR